MAKRASPSEIIEMVDGQDQDTRVLRDRMEDDYGIYRQETTLPADPDNENAGFKVFTSNEPTTFADKLISWQSSAQMLIHTPEHGELRHKREIDNEKEQFLLGVLLLQRPARHPHRPLPVRKAQVWARLPHHTALGPPTHVLAGRGEGTGLGMLPHPEVRGPDTCRVRRTTGLQGPPLTTYRIRLLRLHPQHGSSRGQGPETRHRPRLPLHSRIPGRSRLRTPDILPPLL